jgi:Holliday junction resolvase RusA-like endonuclease
MTKGRAYMDPAYMEHRKDFGLLLRSLNPPKFDGPVAVKLAFMETGVLVYIVPIDDSKRTKYNRGDIDNLTGFVMEVMEDQGIIKNDRDVHELHATVSKGSQQ